MGRDEGGERVPQAAHAARRLPPIRRPPKEPAHQGGRGEASPASRRRRLACSSLGVGLALSTDARCCVYRHWVLVAIDPATCAREPRVSYHRLTTRFSLQPIVPTKFEK